MKIRTKLALASLMAAATATASAQTTENYPDTSPETPGTVIGSQPHLDITSVDVTVDAGATNITFLIHLAGDPVVTNWGNYMVALHAAPGGDPIGRGWSDRPISFAEGMTHWIGCWVNDGGTATGGNGQVWSYSASTWSQTSAPGSVTPTGAGTNTVEIVVAVADLGLDAGETFSFDVYGSGGSGAGAVDALSAATTSINNWSDSFTTDLVGGSPNPALEFTMPGAIGFATWIQGWGLAVVDQDPLDDPDGDTLTNQEEFDAMLDLNPNAIDTDFDNLNDNVETATGTYVDATDTGTLPNNKDTDGDGAEDGDEVNNTSFLGYQSDPNKFNHEFIAIAGSFLTPQWDAAAGSGEGLMTQAGTSLTEQYQWDHQINITATSNGAFKFTNALDWGDVDHWQWGSTGTPNVAARNGGDIGLDVTLTGLHSFSFNTDTLAYSAARTTFASEAEFLTAYGLSAGDDPEPDNLTASQEYLLGTDPTNADTDGDGLDDDVETGGGTWNGPGDTGTNPLDADSDDDGLKDGVEDNSGTFVDANNTGTNPNKLDSDLDGENDGLEVDQGTDPTDINESSASLGIPFTDGTLDPGRYDLRAVQKIQTGFGTANQLDAGYAKVVNGKLHLLLTGNLENSFNKLEIFIDSAVGSSTTFTAVTGNDGSDSMNGMIFDSSFGPEYHLIARRGSSQFDLNFASFGTDTYTFYGDVFGGADFGTGTTGTGVNTQPIQVAYNGSNAAGIGDSAGDAADPTAALAVTTGLELRIDLADLGNPTGPIKVMAVINNSGHDFMSNQSLGGLPVGTGNLGNPATPDFSGLSCDQFFLANPDVSLSIDSVAYLSGSNQFEITVSGLTVGKDYKILESGNLLGFCDVAGSQFNASATSETRTVSASALAGFFSVMEVLAP